MTTTVRLVHKHDMRCEAKAGNAQLPLRIDSLKSSGAADGGPTPMDLLALAHGACTGMLASMKGSAEGVKVDDMDIEVVHEYDAGPPMRLKSAVIRFLVAGGVSAAQVEKMRTAARMCPVHTALRPDVAVSMEFVAKS